MDVVEFVRLVDPLEERRNVEYKPGAPRTVRWIAAKVVRAILGLANLRDGGWVILGVQDRPQTKLVGISDLDLATWKSDDLQATVNAYADPPVRIDRLEVEHDGMKFLVLRVHEFESVPVICKQDSEAEPGAKGRILSRGLFYIRSRVKPETVPVRETADLRELLDLAIDKGIVRFDRDARRRGYRREASDADRFDKELGDLK